MHRFVQTTPTLDSYWRAIILFGRNVASYKFALAKSLLDLAEQEKTSISLEELSSPFARYVSEHLREEDRQGTSSSSRFLDGCREFNAGSITEDELKEITVRHGFENVIDAFHVVNRNYLPIRFFIDERKSAKRIVVTDELLALKSDLQFLNLPREVEARWKLVETAWSLKMSANLLAVSYSEELGELFVTSQERQRRSVTSCRDALNGYQKGKCFYCRRPILITTQDPAFAMEVDHFFPITLAQSPSFRSINLNGVWNLVLSCSACNGPTGKWARVPSIELLERLHARNSYLIDSHHPLRETLMLQTGQTEPTRRSYLQQIWTQAKSSLIHEWKPADMPSLIL